MNLNAPVSLMRLAKNPCLVFHYFPDLPTHEAYSEGDVNIEMFEFLPSSRVGSVTVRLARVGYGVHHCVVCNGVSGPEGSLREEQSRGGVIQTAQLCGAAHGLLGVRLGEADCLTVNTGCCPSVVSPACSTLTELCWPTTDLTCLVTIMEILHTKAGGEPLHSLDTLDT